MLGMNSFRFSYVIPAVTGSWQPWGEWTPCSRGSRWRIRACTDPGGSQHCLGDPVEAEACKTTDCQGVSGTFLSTLTRALLVL